MSTHRQIRLKSFPADKPRPENFELVEEALPQPADDQVLVAVEHLSIDAWITTTLGGGGLHTNIPEGSVVPALGTGRVIAGGSSGLEQGQAVFGPMGAQSHVLLPATALQPLDDSEVPAQAYLGPLGLTTGLTAHVGLVGVGELTAADTVVVSAAAGSVGSFATAIAQLKGATVIGIAGGADKCRYLTETLGAAGAIDYRNDDVAARLKELAPNGVDLFFDNVGGEQLDIVLDQLAQRARVVICGAISQYPDVTNVVGPSRYLRIAEQNASMRGFVVSAWPEHHPAAIADMTQWLKEGALKVPEHVEAGLERFPEALGQLFTGHIGKLLVSV